MKTANEKGYADVIRAAAIGAAYGGEVGFFPEPTTPTEREQCYLYALVAFQKGRQCHGWDLIDKGDEIED